MDWPNDYVLEFLELWSKEPILWDPKNKNHMNRKLVSEAWVRIQKAMPGPRPCSIEIMKRKKNSLLTQYRHYLRKIKHSSKTASSAEEVHQPTWFAFDAMHSFLGDIYLNRPSYSTEVYLFPEDNEDSQDEIETSVHWPPVRENKVEKVLFDLSSEENSESAIDPPSPQSPASAPSPPMKKQKTEEYQKRRKSRKEEHSHSSDECDIYGQLLAMKLRKLNGEDRLRLMNDIDNLTYKHLMAARSNPASSSSKYTIGIRGLEVVKDDDGCE